MENSYPVRINKYLADKNYASRREADKLIAAGRVKINGKIAILGDKVKEGDKVEVSKSALQARALHYIAYNKLKGIVTHSPEEDQESIFENLKLPYKVFPVGRLDRDSHGLIILTNDGRIVDPLLNPKNAHEKEYLVRTDKELTERFLRHMREGMQIEEEHTKPAKVTRVGERAFRIVLTEGKRHQIRRMCAAFDYAVKDLERVRIMNIQLKNLKPGEYRELRGEELNKFLGLLIR